MIKEEFKKKEYHFKPRYIKKDLKKLGLINFWGFPKSEARKKVKSTYNLIHSLEENLDHWLANDITLAKGTIKKLDNAIILLSPETIEKLQLDHEVLDFSYVFEAIARLNHSIYTGAGMWLGGGYGGGYGGFGGFGGGSFGGGGASGSW